MKVIKSEEDILEFDNGLSIVGEGDVDCCAFNYIDFEQFAVGDEFPNMTAKQFFKNIKMRVDGFSMMTEDKTPKWAQARSEQNGYYSNITAVSAKYEGETILLGNLYGAE